ncbi:PREDICTED: uncharacterized protein LOC104714608 isoform X2 [Camelina sativa]|uniref:Uncharacterized protein LOC104714608 isoform X2 n=1 Tax=Camelina sativa TaxID=90675 RepID=A0ABM0TRX6_CAMSA|nr:PREDICTED: uncharacterized protein LOC104714608 isoform X2 [Camelina sativa]
MQFKRRCVTVYRDFPEGCGVPSRRISSSNAADEFLKQSVFQAHGYFPDIKEASSDPLETKTSRIDGLREDGLILESNGGFKYHQEEEGIGGERREDKQKNTSWVKNKALSSHNSTSFTQKKRKKTQVATGVVMDTSRRSIVLGLSAKPNCPWTHPKKRAKNQVTLKSRLFL